MTVYDCQFCRAQMHVPDGAVNTASVCSCIPQPKPRRIEVPTRPRCVKCGDLIPARRLEILPDTQTCVGCSDVEAHSVKDVEIAATSAEDLIDCTSYPDRG